MKTRNLQKLHVAEQKTTNKATRHFRKHMFGEQHPYGFYFGADELTGITLSELKSFYQHYIFPGNMGLLLTGNFDQAEILELLEQEFGDLVLEGKPDLVSPGELGLVQKGRHHVAHEGMQSSLRLGLRGIARSHEDYYAMQVVNTVFGGYFGSRLMRNIREQKGYTYGIYSGFVGLKHTGVFVIQTDVGNEYVEATIAEVKKEMQLMCEQGVSKEELDLVKNYMLGQGISRRETLFQLGDTLRFSLSQGISFEEIDRKFSIITQIQPGEIQALAQKYFQADQLLEVVVGDKAST